MKDNRDRNGCLKSYSTAEFEWRHVQVTGKIKDIHIGAQCGFDGKVASPIDLYGSGRRISYG